MKKMLAGIAAVAVMGVGGVLIAAQPDEPTEQSASKSVEVVEPTEKEVVDIPTARTADISTPWTGANKNIEIAQNKGEVVFLWSDAENVEQRQVEVAGVNPEDEGFKNSPNNYTKEKMAKTTAENLGLFIAEVSQHVDNQPYFDKLEEVKQAMLNGEYDKVPTLIEEAKTLRES